MTPDAEDVKKEGEQAPTPAPKKKAVKRPKAEPEVKVSKEAEKVEVRPAAAPRVKKKAPDGKKDLGLDITPPSKTCNDANCPFHGKLSVRGIMMDCIVVTDRMDKSAVVSRTRLRFVPKFERYEKITSRYTVHNPPCIGAKKGDKVRIIECRPISKTKSFVIIESKGGATNEGGTR
jgi:small subunit ribosomal protein S17